MEIIERKNIYGLQGGMIIAGILALVIGGAIDSMSVLVGGILLMFCAGGLIDRMWVVVEAGEYVVSKMEVVGKIDQTGYVRKKDLPKDVSFVAPYKEVKIVAELFMVAPVVGGFIAFVLVTVVCAGEDTIEGVDRFYRAFHWSAQEPNTFLFRSLQKFQEQQASDTGVFGHKYSLQLGTDEWAGHVFLPKLRQFLQAECEAVGLKIKSICAEPKAYEKSILRRETA